MLSQHDAGTEQCASHEYAGVVDCSQRPESSVDIMRDRLVPSFARAKLVTCRQSDDSGDFPSVALNLVSIGTSLLPGTSMSELSLHPR